MALYIPAARRRRRFLVGVIASLLVGLVVGAILGRTTAPTPQDQASDAKATIDRVVGQLNALPIHYDQAARGEIDRDEFAASLDAGLRRAQRDLRTALDDAARLDPDAAEALEAQLARLVTLAQSEASPAVFDQTLADTVTMLDVAFGTAAATPGATTTP